MVVGRCVRLPRARAAWFDASSSRLEPRESRRDFERYPGTHAKALPGRERTGAVQEAENMKEAARTVASRVHSRVTSRDGDHQYLRLCPAVSRGRRRTGARRRSSDPAHAIRWCAMPQSLPSLSSLFHVRAVVRPVHPMVLHQLLRPCEHCFDVALASRANAASVLFTASLAALRAESSISAARRNDQQDGRPVFPPGTVPCRGHFLVRIVVSEVVIDVVSFA